MSTPSLATLYEKVVGVRVGKADRLTDWLQRPLTDDQVTYAANDVAHLLEVRRRLIDDLERRGRLQWALDECELQRTRHRGQRDPEEVWRRIKEARQLRGKARGVAKAVAAWRERRAATLDIPVRYVLSDIAVVGIAQRPPRNRADLERIRGLDKGMRDDVATGLLAAVVRGLEEPAPEIEEQANGGVDRDLRPAVALISAWVAQLARDLELDTTLLATRGDLEALLRGDEHARFAEGWRGGDRGRTHPPSARGRGRRGLRRGWRAGHRGTLGASAQLSQTASSGASRPANGVPSSVALLETSIESPAAASASSVPVRSTARSSKFTSTRRRSSLAMRSHPRTPSGAARSRCAPWWRAADARLTVSNRR